MTDRDGHRYRYLIAVLLYLVILMPRLAGLSYLAPQADEVHWTARSRQLIDKLSTEPYNATDHLAHPGIPSAFIMGLFQKLGEERFMQAIARDALNYRIIDDLMWARVGNALVTTLAAPLLFLILTSCFPMLFSLLAVLSYGFNPHNMAYFRYAHIDGFLTLFVLLTVITYQRAVLRESLMLKFLAGALFGLAISVKPTALLVVGGFIVYKMGRRVLYRRDLKGEASIISWSDIYALVIGFCILIATYTRWWKHPSYYKKVVKVRWGFARKAWLFGKWLRSNAVISAGVVFLSFIGGMLAHIKYRGVLRHAGGIVILLAAVLSISLINPAIFENALRYLKWITAYSQRYHLRYDHFVPPPKLGYMQIIPVELPLVVTIASVLTVIYLALYGLRGRWSFRKDTLLLFMSVVLSWLCAMQFTQKQSFRYVLPLLPFIYCLAIYGLWFGVRYWAGVRSAVYVVLALIVYQCIAFIRLYPYPEKYTSILEDFFPNSELHRLGVIVGQNELIQFFNNLRGKDDTHNLYVSVLGDAQTLQETKKRLNKAKGVMFDYFPVYMADYLVVFEEIGNPALKTHPYKDIIKQKPLYAVYHRGKRMISVYKCPLPEYGKPLVFSPIQFHRLSGTMKRIKRRKVLELEAGKDRDGAILFKEGFRVGKGVYSLSIEAEILKRCKDRENVLNIKLEPACKRIVTAEEIRLDRTVSLNCPVYVETRLVPIVEWSGKCSARLSQIVFQRQDQHLFPE